MKPVARIFVFFLLVAAAGLIARPADAGSTKGFVVTTPPMHTNPPSPPPSSQSQRSSSCNCQYPNGYHTSNGYLTSNVSIYSAPYYSNGGTFSFSITPNLETHKINSYNPRNAYLQYQQARQNYMREEASSDYYVTGGPIYK